MQKPTPRLAGALFLAAALFFASPQLATAEDTSHWPANVLSNTAFHDIGKAISNEFGFPTHGTEIEKARYAYSRLPEIVSKYKLKAGTGSKISDGLVWLGRQGDSRDGEEVYSMKSIGLGNCSEWSMAFQQILSGAGVQSKVVYADITPDPGFSDEFDETDTSLYVEDVKSDGTKVKRVFDPFRAVHHSQEDGNPVQDHLKKWGDRPLTEEDRMDRDKGTKTWQEVIAKPYVKSQQTESLLPANTKVKLADPKMHGRATNTFEGKWKSSDGAVMLIYKEGDKLTGRMIKRNAKLIAQELPDGFFIFRNGTVKLGPPVSLQSSNAYVYAVKSDCPTLQPHSGAQITLNMDKGKDRLYVSAKTPQYSTRTCRWALTSPWVTENTTWTRVEE